MIGTVGDSIGRKCVLTLEEIRELAFLHLPRVGPRAMQECAARAIYSTHVTTRDRANPLCLWLFLVDIVVEQPGPTTPNAIHLDPDVGNAMHRGLDCGI